MEYVRGRVVSKRSEKVVLYWVEVEEESGNVARYAIRGKGGHIFFVVKPNGYEHLVHWSAQSIEDEIARVFKVRVLRKIPPEAGEA